MANSIVSNTPQGFNGDVNAPVSGTKSNQANASGSIAATGDVKLNTTDARNYGQQFGKIGAGATVETSDPEVTMAALTANAQTAAYALAANVQAQQDALATVRSTNSAAFGFGDNAIDLTRELADRQSRIVTETINSATDQAREAAARSESVVQSALTKLADQRAPDGANLTKLALWLGLAVAAVVALRAFFTRSKS